MLVPLQGSSSLPADLRRESADRTERPHPIPNFAPKALVGAIQPPSRGCQRILDLQQFEQESEQQESGQQEFERQEFEQQVRVRRAEMTDP